MIRLWRLPWGTIGAVVRRVTAVEAISDHELRLTFDDGLVRDLDMAPMMWGELGKPLRDPAFFRLVRVDADSRSIAWPNGFEPDPDVLHGDFPPAASGESGRVTARKRRWARLGRAAIPLSAVALIVGAAGAVRMAGRILTSR